MHRPLPFFYKTQILGIFAFIGFFLFAGASAAESTSVKEEPSLEHILHAHIKAMGTLQRWEAVHSVRMSGRFELQQKGVRFSEWRRKPNLMRVQWTTQSQREPLLDVGCNRDIAWYISRSGNQVRKSTIPASQAEALRRKAQLENSILKEGRLAFRHWELLPQQLIGGVECFVLRHSLPKEPEETFFLDAKTYYILRREIKTEKGVEIEEFGDYRLIDDIPWPHRLVFFENGEKSEVAVVDSIKINTGISSIFFRPPMDMVQSQEEGMETKGKTDKPSMPRKP